MKSTRDSLQQRFKNVLTLPGTQCCHNFIPVDSKKVAARRISSDGKPLLVFNLYKPGTTLVTARFISTLLCSM